MQRTRQSIAVIAAAALVFVAVITFLRVEVRAAHPAGVHVVQPLPTPDPHP